MAMLRCLDGRKPALPGFEVSRLLLLFAEGAMLLDAAALRRLDKFSPPFPVAADPSGLPSA